jgi:hypothetical protein
MQNKNSLDFSKQRELETYRKLALTRETKSKARRRSVEADGIYIFIGGRDLERPWLKVLKKDYVEARKKILLQKKKGLREVSDAVLPEVERAVYDELAYRQNMLKAIERKFRQEHKRGFTPHEAGLYTSALKQEGGIPDLPERRARRKRETILNEVLQKIESCQDHQPERLQQAWAEVVGIEAAQQTFLERVEVESGTAVCKCLSSTLAFELRRNRNLPKQLSAKLGLPIRRLVFK